MSAVTPDHILSSLAQGGQPIVTVKDFRKYMLDLNGWFMWWGVHYDLSGKSVGGGLMKLSATPWDERKRSDARDA